MKSNYHNEILLDLSNYNVLASLENSLNEMQSEENKVCVFITFFKFYNIFVFTLFWFYQFNTTLEMVVDEFFGFKSIFLYLIFQKKYLI
jgi:hypothetical protein